MHNRNNKEQSNTYCVNEDTCLKSNNESITKRNMIKKLKMNKALMIIKMMLLMVTAMIYIMLCTNLVNPKAKKIKLNKIMKNCFCGVKKEVILD